MACKLLKCHPNCVRFNYEKMAEFITRHVCSHYAYYDASAMFSDFHSYSWSWGSPLPSMQELKKSTSSVTNVDALQCLSVIAANVEDFATKVLDSLHVKSIVSSMFDEFVERDQLSSVKLQSKIESQHAAAVSRCREVYSGKIRNQQQADSTMYMRQLYSNNSQLPILRIDSFMSSNGGIKYAQTDD